MVEETDRKLELQSFDPSPRSTAPEVTNVRGDVGYSQLPQYREPPGGHSMASISDPWRGALYAALICVAGDVVSIACRNVIRRYPSEPYRPELEHKPR